MRRKSQMQGTGHGVIIISERESIVEYTLHELRVIKRMMILMISLEITRVIALMMAVIFRG